MAAETSDDLLLPQSCHIFMGRSDSVFSSTPDDIEDGKELSPRYSFSYPPASSLCSPASPYNSP